MAEALEETRIYGKRALLHPSCVEGFKADRAAGLIYGPYRVYDPSLRKYRFAQDAEEASVLGRFCPYCSRGE